MPTIRGHISDEILAKAKHIKETGSQDEQIHDLEMLESLIKLAREDVGY